jgi:hypothetical protein
VNPRRFGRAPTLGGSALIVALLVLALAAVVALAGARGSAFGLRVASAGQLRLQVRAAAENALERALAQRLPVGDSIAAWTENVDGHVVRTEVARDRRLPLGAPPLDGFSTGIGGGAFGAEHYVARAAAGTARGHAATFEQQFYLLVPEGP